MQLSKLSLRVITLQCLLGLMLPALTNAQMRSPGHPAPSAITTEVAQLNIYMDKRDRINVVKALNLQSRLLQGAKILSLSVTGSSNDFNTKVVLKLNGQKIDTAPLGHYSSERHLKVPGVLSSRDRLVLTPTDNAFISSIKAVVETSITRPMQPAPVPGERVLKARVNERVYGHAVLPVRKLVHQASGVNLQGLKIDKVVLRGSSTGRYGMARVQLVVNGMTMGMPQTLPLANQRLVFDLPEYAMNVIGHDIQTLQIKVTGDAHIQMVGIKKDTPALPRSFQAYVGKIVRGSERMSLAQLVSHAPGAHPRMAVESITITARGSGNIMVTNGFSMAGSVQVSRWGSDTQSIAVHGARLEDIKLRASGNMTIESIRVNAR